MAALAPLWEPARHAPYYTSPAGDTQASARPPPIPSKGTELSYGLLVDEPQNHGLINYDIFF